MCQWCSFWGLPDPVPNGADAPPAGPPSRPAFEAEAVADPLLDQRRSAAE